ncbi:uncharacterized protein LOC113362058 isoform X2 [Papaver somniferum]|uniref:uncharacterized protein LOC113362058 isoform X2 n=1 Tax=Papaver somniferum TaxID=3469 RepID=UPI000E702DD0|nr:uncharacterized protein LOC113362058 isoform X2 [Papaver somniferum]
MSAAREIAGANQSRQEMMDPVVESLGRLEALLKVLVESQVHTQHQLSQIVRNTSITEYNYEKDKVIQSPSSVSSNFVALAPPLKLEDQDTLSANAINNFSVNMERPFLVYEEEITQVKHDDRKEQELQPFEFRQQLETISDFAGQQRALNQKFKLDEEGDQTYVLDEFKHLFNAAKCGDCEFLKKNPQMLAQVITTDMRTALHVAVFNMRFTFVEEIVKLIPPKALECKTREEGYTALHLAAMYGYAKTAEVMVRENPKLTQIEDGDGSVPLDTALTSVTVGQRKTVEYLYSVTRHDHPSPFSGQRGASLLCNTIEVGFYDIALLIVQRYPQLIIERSKYSKVSGLELMAERPFAFKSGARLTFWGRFFYSFYHMDSTDDHGAQINNTHVNESFKGINIDEENPHQKFEGSYRNQVHLSESSENMEGGNEKLPKSSDSNKRKLIMVFLAYLMRYMITCSPARRIKHSFKQLYNEKVMHKQAKDLVKCMLTHLKRKMNKRQVMDFFDKSSVIKTAIKQGTIEFVEEYIEIFPFLIWNDMAGQSMMEMAMDERNEMIVNLICDASEEDKSDLVCRYDIKGNTILHHAAKLAPSVQLNSVSGAYLQMQRELQWFKGVENMMPEKNKFNRNRNGDTAQYIFTEEHMELKEKGEKLLKDTSGSCMVVAALIATVAFAAAFTVPGGNISDINSVKNGVPVYLGSASFLAFAVADALALFSSVTSVLMFLAIYTSRYAEVDFLRSLPQKLLVGLVSLFVSMATILIAFGASLYIVLGNRLPWAPIPIALLSCVPFSLFTLLQLPLFSEMIRSTYWGIPLQKHKYIFSKQVNIRRKGTEFRRKRLS